MSVNNPPPHQIIAAIDYGLHNIGVAISDASLSIASPLSTITHKNWSADIAAIKQCLSLYNITKIILGEPLNEDGTDSKQTINTRLFGEQLEKHGFSVAYCDERYSTIEAREILRKSGYRPDEIKKRIDQAAAAVILQRYLDQLQHSRSAVNPNNSKKEGQNTMSDNKNEYTVDMIDDDGNTVSFEHLMTLEYQNQQYVALGMDSDDEDTTDVMIARIDKDENGADIYSTDIPDDISEAVFNMAIELIESEDSDDEGDETE